MQGFASAVRPRFVAQLVNRPSPKTFRLKSFSSSSSDFNNQSRGGVPRFFSEVLPSSKGSSVRVGDEFWQMAKFLGLSPNDRVELFNGKGGVIEGCIHRTDRSGLDFVAVEDPKLVLPHHTRWHVFAAFGQWRHEMVLNPPMRIDGLLPFVAQSKPSSGSYSSCHCIVFIKRGVQWTVNSWTKGTSQRQLLAQTRNLEKDDQVGRQVKP